MTNKTLVLCFEMHSICHRVSFGWKRDYTVI